MDRIWQWTWDRYGARYSWALWAMSLPIALLTYGFWSFLIVVCEHSDRFLAAAVVTVVAVPVLLFVVVLPGWGGRRLLEQWAAGHEVDRAEALGDTYT